MIIVKNIYFQILNKYSMISIDNISIDIIE